MLLGHSRACGLPGLRPGHGRVRFALAGRGLRQQCRLRHQRLFWRLLLLELSNARGWLLGVPVLG